ncbi:glycosyltransferase [Rhodanobacter terrae]|uniref:Glycosyltransferase n=1 Tax=Rhodanobacter terrae TaxID=418647 RepID=A0ABW0SS47_9GAMM
MSEPILPTLLVLASTYPRWRNDPEPGFVHELCRRLVDRFHVIALVPDAPGADLDGVLDGVEVVRFRYAPRRWQTLVNDGGIVTNLRRFPWKWLLVPGFVLSQYLAARRLLRRRKVDIVHAHWLIPQGLIARRLKLGTAVPYLVTSHGGDLFGLRGRWLEVLKRRVAGSSSAMTVVSTAMRDEALRINLHPPELVVLPMGVDLRERFVVDAQVERSRDELLFVGRLVPKKGLPHLLNAMPAVLAGWPEVTLTIAGFGPEESSLRIQVRQLGIEKHVNFLGAMSQEVLPGLYRRASIFVAPFIRDDSGNQEGLPVVLMEAIGCGCPVIVGDVAGVRDLLGDVAQGVCVDARNAQVLASAILAALGNPQQAQERAQKIRLIAADRVDWRVISDGYAGLLESCIHHAAIKDGQA